MKELAFLQPAPVYIEIGLDSLKALRGDDGLEVPLERLSNGRLAGSCKERLGKALKAFLKKKSWQPRSRAFCAIGASGVSLRRLTLPPAAREEFQRLLLLQIENAFPLPPDELAWGALTFDGPPVHAGAAGQELLVAAVRKEMIEDYAGVLLDCGTSPVFTLSALARASLHPELPESYAMLDIRANHSEWVVFEQNVPAAVRLLPWGSANFVAANGSLESLARSLRGNWPGQTLFLTGGGEDQSSLASSLASHLGDGIECRPLAVAPGTGRSAATVGLQKCVERHGGTLPLVLRVKPKPAEGRLQWSEPALRKSALTVAVLLIALLALPYAEAFVLKPFLSRKLATIQSQEGRLATIDREMNFLQFLKENQPPYLDALYLFARAAPPGTRLDSLSMNRRGDVSLRGSMRNSAEVIEFRSKLIKSGFFSAVSVEEQVPTPDHQKVNVRMTAQWKPSAARELLAIGPSAAEIEKAKAGARKPSSHSEPRSGGPSMIAPHGSPAARPTKH